jgi:hypothetical protein
MSDLFGFPFRSSWIRLGLCQDTFHSVHMHGMHSSTASSPTFQLTLHAKQPKAKYLFFFFAPLDLNFFLI